MTFGSKNLDPAVNLHETDTEIIITTTKYFHGVLENNIHKVKNQTKHGYQPKNKFGFDEQHTTLLLKIPHEFFNPSIT